MSKNIEMKIETNPYSEMSMKNNMSFDQAYNPSNYQTIDVSNKNKNARYDENLNPGFNSERITPRVTKKSRAPPLYNWQDKYMDGKNP